MYDYYLTQLERRLRLRRELKAEKDLLKWGFVYGHCDMVAYKNGVYACRYQENENNIQIRMLCYQLA